MATDNRAKKVAAFQEYLADLKRIRASGAAVPEMSYYTPFANLLNSIGARLTPTVRCIMSISNEGAGLPDGGLFTAEQVARTSEPFPLESVVPARGAIELKPSIHDIGELVSSSQVRRYLRRYGQVLSSNLREFKLLVLDGSDVMTAESFSLADSDAEFWLLIKSPKRAEAVHVRFEEFLLRVLLRGAALYEPRDLAFLLASYARESREIIVSADIKALRTVRTALEESLGPKFQDEKGKALFQIVPNSDAILRRLLCLGALG